MVTLEPSKGFDSKTHFHTKLRVWHFIILLCSERDLLITGPLGLDFRLTSYPWLQLHSFSRYLLSTYCVPDTVLGSRGTASFLQRPDGWLAGPLELLLDFIHAKAIFFCCSVLFCFWTMVDPHIYYLLLVADAFFSILAPKIALLISWQLLFQTLSLSQGF